MSDSAMHLIWLDGYVAGLEAYAWWKDGVQYVGSCGTTLADAVRRAETDSDMAARAANAAEVSEMNKHTPGPWVVGKAARNPYPDPPGDKWSIAAYGCWIAGVYPFVRGCQDDSEAKANARLIAAAPDLLEACRAMVDCYEGGMDSGCDPPRPDCPACQARAAIAKAEGGKGIKVVEAASAAGGEA